MIFVDSLCSNCDKAILEILNFNCISYKVTRSNNDLVTSMLFIVLTYTSVHTVILINKLEGNTKGLSYFS